MLHVYCFQLGRLAGCRGGVDPIVIHAQSEELREERDEIETTMVVPWQNLMSRDLVATLVDLRTIDGSKKYFAHRPVPSYGHRYALAILSVPPSGGVCLSKVGFEQERGLECCRCGVIKPSVLAVETDQVSGIEEMEVCMTIGYLGVLPLSILVLVIGLNGCQRETPVEKSQASQSPSVVDQAVRQSVDAIQTPMDKARGVEGTLSDAAGRTADRVQEGTP